MNTIGLYRLYKTSKTNHEIKREALQYLIGSESEIRASVARERFNAHGEAPGDCTAPVGIEYKICGSCDACRWYKAHEYPSFEASFIQELTAGLKEFLGMNLAQIDEQNYAIRLLSCKVAAYEARASLEIAPNLIVMAHKIGEQARVEAAAMRQAVLNGGDITALVQQAINKGAQVVSVAPPQKIHLA